MRKLRLATLAVLLTFPFAAQAQYLFFGWRLGEFQPDIRNGGRVNTIAVNPSNNDVIVVASETGGLFRSTDRGATWRHMDGLLPAYATSAVAFVPADPTILIATTRDDFRTTPGGGIWRSTNSGTTWSQVAGPPAPAGVTARLSAYEISIAPDTGTIYVATEYGVSISPDRGVTWTHVDPFGAGDHRVFSVVAQNGGRVLAAGPAGIRRSATSGTSWFPPTTGAGAGIWDIHALGRSPFSSNGAYVVNGNTELWYTEDAGDHWTRIMGAPAGGGSCGGISFVKATGRVTKVPRPSLPPLFLRSVTLYAGNRCWMSRLTTPPRSATTGFDYSGAWTAVGIDHGDTRDLAFANNRVPLLLGTDGGLHNTADGGATWSFAGGGHNGYNALQITEVKDQWITDLGRHDLFFGTQDNDVLGSIDDGVTWPNRVCCEGFFIERLHRVATAANSQITFVSCGGCANRKAGAGLTSVGFWNDPVSPPAGNPAIVRHSFHVQGVAADTTYSKGFAVTTNLGTTWAQYASLPEDRRSMPRLSDPATLPVQYQAIRTGWYGAGGFEINHLARMVKNAAGNTGTITYPAMNGFGGLGINPTMFAWYQVFAVDPGNTQHLIAPDVVNQSIKETWDGGDNWTDIPALTAQVTGSGTYLFRSWIFPLASAVSFSEEDPRVVAVGTQQNGLFVSGDRGATWFKVPGSERVTYITSIQWNSATNAVISTYGRGLWRMSWGLIRPLPHFEPLCELPCIIRPWPWERVINPEEKFKQAVLVFDGVLQGAKATNGVLREVFVSPGASAVFFTDAKSMNVKVTETAKRVGFGGAVPPSVENRSLRGLTLDDRGRVLGAVFTEKPLKMHEPAEKDRNQERQPVGRKESPTAGKPYLQLDIPSGADNRVAPNEPIAISGRSFPPNTTLEIAVDDRVVEKIRVSDNGTFAMRIIAPREFGLHAVTVRDAQTGKVIDGSMFLVVHEDKRKER